jgi:DNA topoisomerase-1
MKNLVIVESPAKAKTIEKYLGKGFEVCASMGHLRDLPKSELGVDIENGFSPKYIPIQGKKELVKKLKTAAESSDRVYLATDPDREGEAISWHLKQLLNIDDKKAMRVTFNEITPTVVKREIEKPRNIDQNLVDAQQARRILDRIVGYKLSPFLWRKVKKGLSAGRVQSVAVKLIVDREREIEAFKPQEFWNITAELKKNEKNANVFLSRFYGDANGKIDVSSGQQASDIVSKLQNAEYSVLSIKNSEKKRSPQPPFITSTLQQEASRRFGLPAKRTMALAQELYEGVEVKGHGQRRRVLLAHRINHIDT